MAIAAAAWRSGAERLLRAVPAPGACGGAEPVECQLDCSTTAGAVKSVRLLRWRAHGDGAARLNVLNFADGVRVRLERGGEFHDSAIRQLA